MKGLTRKSSTHIVSEKDLLTGLINNRCNDDWIHSWMLKVVKAGSTLRLTPRGRQGEVTDPVGHFGSRGSAQGSNDVQRLFHPAQQEYTGDPQPAQN